MILAKEAKIANLPFLNKTGRMITVLRRKCYQVRTEIVCKVNPERSGFLEFTVSATQMIAPLLTISCSLTWKKNIGDNSEKYNNYIDSYDRNAVNIALEDDSMSQKDLERAIQELIEFVISRNRNRGRGRSLHLDPTRLHKKRDERRAQIFNDARNPKQIFSTKTKPKTNHRGRHMHSDIPHRSDSYRRGRNSRSKSTKYERDEEYLEEHQERSYHDRPVASRAKKYRRDSKNLETNPSHRSYDTTDLLKAEEEEESPDDIDFYRKDENENPYDVMYIKKKVVTIEETADGKQSRKTSDLTETRRIARSKSSRYPTYLHYLPIPSEIKHRIGKRSAPNNGNKYLNQTYKCTVAEFV